MKKSLIILVLIIGVGFFLFNIDRKNNLTLKDNNLEVLADARLSLVKVEKKVENKIDFILDNVVNNDATLNDKEMNSLIQDISIIRAYGKDISKESKIKLLKIIKILATKHNPNIELLKKLKDIAVTSQLLSA